MCYRFSPNEIAPGKFTWIHGTREFPLTVPGVILWVNKNPKRVNQSRECEMCQRLCSSWRLSCTGTRQTKTQSESPKARGA